MAQILTRETFETSRESEYFTEKELRAQIILTHQEITK